MKKCQRAQQRTAPTRNYMSHSPVGVTSHSRADRLRLAMMAEAKLLFDMGLQTAGDDFAQGIEGLPIASFERILRDAS